MIEFSNFNNYDMVKEVHGLFSRHLSEPYAYPTFTYYFAVHSSTSFVAKAGPKIIGAILCMETQGRGQISMLCVTPGYRRLGIGKYLIYKSLLAMKNQGIEKIELETDSSNHIALNLYERMGFERRNFYERCYFNLRSSYVMVLDLTAQSKSEIVLILKELKETLDKQVLIHE